MEREKQPKQQDQNPPSSSSLLSQNPKDHQIVFAESPRNVSTANDRLKRDEWSEGAVSSLLEAYEAKWTLRNRAKLKGQDWEDVAKHVSGRANGSKSAKTQTQCKNKIESMKKRYRSESAAADASSWPLYPRLDLLLRGNGPFVGASNPVPPPVMVVELPSIPTVLQPPPLVSVAVAATPAVLEMGRVAQKSHGWNDGDKEEGEGTNNGAKTNRNQELEENPIDDTDSNTPPIDDFQKGKPNMKARLKKKNNINSNNERRGKSMKRGREEYLEMRESIRWLAEMVMRSEQTRMETMKEIERMRAETEAKRGEMDLKRTEIIANTQLQIAKLFAKGSVDDWKKST